MAFTKEDRDKLERARRTVTELEAKENEAVSAMRGVLWDAGLRLCPETQWSDIANHADAIRDALEPFDSGIRESAE